MTVYIPTNKVTGKTGPVKQHMTQALMWNLEQARPSDWEVVMDSEEKRELSPFALAMADIGRSEANIHRMHAAAEERLEGRMMRAYRSNYED